MQTRRLGSSDLYLSTVGLGTWGMSGSGWRGSWGPQDDSESIKAIIRAYDLGVNWIDTAAVYGLGHSEEVVGKALKEMPERPIIATKLGSCWDENGEIFRRLTKESVRKEVEDSLRQLDIDAIDLYQIHWPIDDNHDEVLEGWATMADLTKEGKIRYAGVSNFGVELMSKIQKIHTVTSLQPPYSMTRRGIEKEILPYCGENNIGVVCYSPMGKGLLTGKFSKERVDNLSDEDHRKRGSEFHDPQLSITLGMLDELRPIADKNGRTLAQLAIAWVLRRPEVTAAIVGTRRPSQIEETAKAGDWNLSQGDIAKIDQILERYQAKLAEAKS
jgi:aryl-alcohol dehydrogenase-like predicted oxidoreductase